MTPAKPTPEQVLEVAAEIAQRGRIDDPYTMEMRLCDEDGMVSRRLIPPDGNFAPIDATYIGRLNRLRLATPEVGDGPEELVSEEFPCTGHAHLGGGHIRCTSTAHRRREATGTTGFKVGSNALTLPATLPAAAAAAA